MPNVYDCQWNGQVYRSFECRVIRPVLKHGLRSSLHVQEFGCMKSLARNESKEHSCNVLSVISVIWCKSWQWNATLTGSIAVGNGLSKSICNETRKMVNLMCVEWSQGKPWWKFVAVLTCKSIVKHALRGERLIEPSSSWFRPKFPSG